MSAEEAPPRLAVRKLSKSFGGTHALRHVDLTVLPGEIHGLLGENGSGKSTLIKILSGFHAPEEGQLLIDGQEVELPLATGEFRALGMAFVHQDLALVESMSVLENLRVGEIAGSRNRWRIPWRRERTRATETFARYRIQLDPDATVAELKPVERALLAIVRALEELRNSDRGHGLLVLDEPTAFLPKDGIERLFALIRQVAAAGASVLFVSHDMHEVREITDRVTVLRDGTFVGTAVTSGTSESAFVEMIIGRELAELAEEHHDLHDRPDGLTVQDLAGPGVASGTFEVRAGEIVGLTGLLGAGFEEIPYLLYGARRASGGQMLLSGTSCHLPDITPRKAIEMGIALIPADRPTDGSVLSLPVLENVALPVLDRYFNGLWLNRRRMRENTRRILQQFDVRPDDPALAYGNLSGGNQQKALLAKWFQTDPQVLLLDEPTQGVDVGARQQIFELLRSTVAERRIQVLISSSDYEQLALLCDRVLIFGRGRILRELAGANLTQERILEQAMAATAPDVAGVVT